MRTSINCSTTIAAVLHRVFVAPAQSPTLHSSVIGQHHAARNIPRFVATTNFVARRTIVTSAAADKRETRLPRDEEIASRSVLVVQPDNSLKIEHKKQLLSTLDLTQYSLVQVIPMEPGKLPICKIIDKKALYAQKKAKAENAKKSKQNAATKSKTIELNWAIEQGDLGHRLKKLQDFLGKGVKVEVMIAPKRRGKIATQEDAAEVVKQLKAAALEVPGAREVKGTSGIIGKEYTVAFEAPAPIQKPVDTKKDSP